MATTSQRGYGRTHQQARQTALHHLQANDGLPCHHCRKPMWFAHAHALDLDHTDDRTGYRGLAHSSCNRRAGQAKTMRQRRASQQVKHRSRQW